MQIGIAAEFVGVKSCGPATYTRNLLQGLAELETDHRFVAYLASERGRAMVPETATTTSRIVPPYNAWLRLSLSLPAELLRRPVDLLHAQGWAPPWSPCPMVATIHDILWETHPAAYTPALRWRLSRLVRHTARQALRVITSSHYSAGQLMRLYGVPAEKIRVIYPALSPAMASPASPAEVDRVRRHYGLTGPYILNLGVIEPKKNVDKLLLAYAALQRSGPLEHQLVIAGPTGWLAEPVLTMARGLGLGQAIRLLGEVPAADIAALYTGADVFAFLSAAEGFGYPPLEAMACGTPVLAANATSLPEVLGEAALLVDPLQPEQVQHSLERLCQEAALRQRLRSAGLGRVRDFQPAPLARQVVSVYEECARPVHHSRAIPTPSRRMP